MNLSNLTWGKIGSLIVAGLGLIVQYTPQLQDTATALHLSPNAGLFITLIAGIATQILSAIHSHQLETIQNATPTTGVPVAKVGLFLIGFLLLASASQAGILSYLGVPLNPGIGTTQNDLLVGPVEIAGVNLNNTNQVNLGVGFGLIDANVIGLSSTTSSINANWGIGILGKAYLQNTNPDYVNGTFGVFAAVNLVGIVFNNYDLPLLSLSGERLPDGSIQGFFNLVDLVGLGSNSSYRKINR